MNGFYLKSFLNLKRLMILCLLFILSAGGLFFINHRQPDEFLAQKLEFYTAVKADLEDNRMNIIIAEQLGHSTEKDVFYLENIDQQLDSVNQIIQKFQTDNYFIADLEESFYLHRQEMLNVRLDSIGNDFPAERAKATYMQTHQLPYLEEISPTNSALFHSQLAELIFTPFTAFMLLLLFVLPLFIDIDNQQLEWFASLPKSNHQFLTKYFVHLLMAMAVIVIMFSISILPLAFKQQLDTFIYPVLTSIGEQVRAVPIWQWLLLRIGAFVIVVLLMYLILLLMIRWLKSFEMAFIIMAICFFVFIFWSFLDPDLLANPMVGLTHSSTAFYQSSYPMNSLVQFILLTCLILYIQQSKYMNESLNQLIMSNRMNRDNYFLNRLFDPLPAWLKFEWLAIYKKSTNRRLLILVGLLLIIAYGAIAYQSIAGARFMVSQLEESARQHELDYYFYQEFENRQLKQLEYQYQDAFADSDNVTFRDWLSQNDPETYETIVKNSKASNEKLLINQTLLEKFKSGTVQSADLTDYQIALGEAILAYDNPYYNGYYSPDIISFYDESKKYEAAKEVKQRNTDDYYQVETLSIPHFGSEFQEGITLQMPVDHSVMYSGYLLVQWYTPLILFLFIILVAPIFSDLFGRHQAIQWYQSLPLQSPNLFWVKLGANISHTVILLLLFIGIFMLMSFILGGWGEMDYPVRIFDAAEIGSQPSYSGIRSGDPVLYFRFVSVSSYLMRALSLIGLLSLFVSLLIHLMGLIFNQRVIATIASLALIGLGAYFSVANVNELWPSYLPFIYFDIRSVIDGWYQSLTNTTYYSSSQGLIVLCVWCVVLFGLSYLVFSLKRRRYRWS